MTSAETNRIALSIAKQLIEAGATRDEAKRILSDALSDFEELQAAERKS